MGDPVVTVKQGKLRGITQDNVLGSSYLAFRGVPFALPPVGELRFKDPEAPAPWTGIRDASKNVGDICSQIDEFPPHSFIGGEDCLYLNVYTQSIAQSKPVMVWVHGGGFRTGTGNDTWTMADYLISKDVVVVSPNYRLGVFGFLNLSHKAAPGNQGLKDIIAALKWTKENISNFGGDPNNITIFGASAGAALSHFLSISPAAKGLFQKAILQSGTGISPWSSLKENNPQQGFKLAAHLGLESSDPTEVVEFLRTIPHNELTQAHEQIITPEQRFRFDITFLLNSDQHAEHPVLPGPIEELMANDSDITYIIGYTSHEFIMFMKDTSKKSLQGLGAFLEVHAGKIAPSDDPVEIARFAKTIKDSHFHGKPIDETTVTNFQEFETDVLFMIPANRVADNRRKRKCAPTYVYKYSYIGGEKTVTDVVTPERAVKGASHVDEISYIFYIPRLKMENPEAPAVGTKDRITLERMTRMWTDFAKTGNPTPRQDECVDVTWKPVTKEEFNYLEIGDDLKMSTMDAATAGR